jgi:hypothetical protein
MMLTSDSKVTFSGSPTQFKPDSTTLNAASFNESDAMQQSSYYQRMYKKQREQLIGNARIAPSKLGSSPYSQKGPSTTQQQQEPSFGRGFGTG